MIARDTNSITTEEPIGDFEVTQKIDDELLKKEIYQPGKLHYIQRCHNIPNTKHYYTYDANQIGQGGSSEVFKIEAKFTIPYFLNHSSKGDKHYVVKRRLLRNEMLDAQYEFNHTPPHLHMKPPVEDIYSFLTMKKISGKNFFDYLVNFRKDYTTETVDSLIDLSIQMVYQSMQKTLHEGLIHRDLKFDNYLYDGKHLVVFDYGYAKEINSPNDGHHCGTPTFAAPEINEGEFTSKSDAYACGISLCYIWGAEQWLLDAHTNDFLKPENRTDISYQQLASKIRFIFDEEEEFRFKESKQWRKILNQLKHPLPEPRLDLYTAFKQMQAVRLTRRLYLHLENPDKENIQSAHQIALTLFDTLTAQSPIHFYLQAIAKDKLPELQTLFTQAIEKLSESPFAVDEFIDVLQIKEFRAETKENLKKTITGIFTSYQQAITNLEKMQTDIEQLPLKDRLLSAIVLRIQAALQKQSKFKMNLENLQELTDRLEKKIVSINEDLRKYYHTDSLEKIACALQSKASHPSTQGLYGDRKRMSIASECTTEPGQKLLCAIHS